MKNGFTLTGLAIIFLGLAAGINGQTSIVQTAPRVTEFTFAVQPDCPLHLAVGNSSMRLPSTPIEISTKDERAINGSVLLIESEGQQQFSINVRPEMPIALGRSAMQGFGMSFGGLKTMEKVSISVDFVRFVDGGTWGSDTAGGSKVIAAFLSGRELATKRLSDLLAESNLDPANFFAPIKAFGSASFGGPVTMKQDLTIIRREGYRGILKALRTANKNTAEAQDLARKLEFQENSLDQ